MPVKEKRETVKTCRYKLAEARKSLNDLFGVMKKLNPTLDQLGMDALEGLTTDSNELLGKCNIWIKILGGKK